MTEHAPDQLCVTCGSPLAGDQHYCLNCGRRVGDRRDDLLQALAPPPAAPSAPSLPAVVPPPPPPRGPLLWSPLGAGALGGLLALGLLFGGLAFGGEEQKQPITVNVPKQEAPRVVNNISGGGAAVPVSEFISDWPGDDGWTIQLDTLPKDGTDVAAVDAAKSDATGKGAKDVGALDSDEYGSLTPGEYVIYSGVFDSKKAATKALGKLKKDFAGAKVVKVSGGGGAPKLDKDAKQTSDDELKELEGASGDDFVKKSKKLPDKVGTSGAAPKIDKTKPPGGEDAGDATVIG